jgi:predicted Rossmann fold flavoprotein
MRKGIDRVDITVIGAGPAGLFCAIHAAKQDCRVLVIEKMQAPGRKLLLAGSGQCNITHGGEIREFLSHYGEAGKFLQPALLAFTNHDLMKFFHERGLAMEVREDGKVFPATRKSSDVLSHLISACEKQGVAMRFGEPVTGLTKEHGGFTITTSRNRYHASCLVIATGGASYPATGSTGDGYRFAASLGHTVTEIAPALVPLLIREFPFFDLAGMSFPGMHFSVWREGKKLFHHTGDVLFTHTGLSGPGILDCSRNIRPGDVVHLSFIDRESHEGLRRRFPEQSAARRTRRVTSMVSEYHIPERLIKKILELAGIPQETTCAHLSRQHRSALVSSLTGYPLTVDALGDFSVAMVTRGGIARSEVNPKTMESRIVKNLYFAGEVLDIDGDTGGYNIQSAFSTGMLAAQGISRKFSDK